jgi:hypothetical protein
VPKALKTPVSRVTTPPGNAASEVLPLSGSSSGSIACLEGRQGTSLRGAVIIHQNAQAPSDRASTAPPAPKELPGFDLPEPSRVELPKAAKEVQPPVGPRMNPLASETIPPHSESDPAQVSSTVQSLPSGWNFQLAGRVVEPATTARRGEAQPSKGGEVAERAGGSEIIDSFKLRPAAVHKMIVDEISTAGSPRASQNRLTIGRIEVRVNNVSRPVESKARGPVTSSLASDFLEESYLNRFAIKP